MLYFIYKDALLYIHGCFTLYSKQLNSDNFYICLRVAVQVKPLNDGRCHLYGFIGGFNTDLYGMLYVLCGFIRGYTYHLCGVIIIIYTDLYGFMRIYADLYGVYIIIYTGFYIMRLNI